MDIGSVLSRSWQIIWRHKILWIFGILASCSSTNYFQGNYRQSYNREISPEFNRFFSQLPNWEIALIIGIAVLVVLFIVILAIFLGTMGRIGLIRGTLQAEQGAVSLSFGELFSGGLPYFWRVFGLNLLVGLAFAALVIITVVPLAITVIGLVCLIPLICILVPLAWIVGVVVEQANVAIVTEDLNILDGLRRGWEVVKNNPGVFIVMALILLLGVGFIGSFVIGLPIVAIIGPAVVGAIAGTPRALRGGLALTGLCLVFYIPVAIVLYGILQSYIKTAWTLTYLRLSGRQAAIQAQPSPIA